MGDPYIYRPLDEAAKEIRLVQLLPGASNEQLQIRLIHVPLEIPEPAPITRIKFRDLNETLPADWTVGETLEGRYIFWKKGLASSSTYVHPNNLDEERYVSTAIEDPYPDYYPEYEALSYAWGAADIAEEVMVTETVVQRSFQEEQDIGNSGRLKVWLNLYEALNHLRETDSSRLLWIDAISINQQDETERNHQVKRMGNIYKLARRVTIWLGLESSNGSSSNALNILRDIGTRLESTSTTWIHNPLAAEKEGCYLSGPLPMGSDDFSSIKALLERSWFSRLWIWQEVQLSAHRAIVQCGQDCIPWIVLRRSIARLAENTTNDKALDRLLIVRHPLFTPCIIAHMNMRATMYGLLRRTHGAQFAIDHDRIYGLLGLANPIISKHVPTDYTLPVGRIFQGTCLGILAETKTLHFLESCNISHNTLEEKPSWVPNFLFQALYSPEEAFATGYSKANDAHLVGNNVLEVYGVECGYIQYVDMPAPVEGALRDTLHLWSSNLQSYFKNARDAIEEAILSITYRLVSPVYSVEQHQAECHDFLLGDGEHAFIDNRSAKQNIMRLLRGRSACIIEGRVGFCPKESQKGDLVAVFLGSNYPMVLRPSGSDTYSVVGPCRAFHLSDTKALLGELDGNWRGLATWNYRDRLVRHAFKNLATGELSFQDPRLGELPKGWRFKTGYDPHDPDLEIYEDEATGEITTLDPRMSAEALKSRGVPIRSFHLA